MSPVLGQIADARINFQSQGGGGPGGRDISMMLAGDDPVLLESAARTVVEQMKTLPNIRAPRVEGDLPRPEITIKPLFDLAADMGVTTSALSQTIRIATLGDIDQNSAKFSLSDRQVPITVSLLESTRRDLTTLENLPVPTANGSAVPLKAVADSSFGEGPTKVRRYNQSRRIMIESDLSPGTALG